MADCRDRTAIWRSWNDTVSATGKTFLYSCTVHEIVAHDNIRGLENSTLSEDVRGLPYRNMHAICTQVISSTRLGVSTCQCLLARADSETLLYLTSSEPCVRLTLWRRLEANMAALACRSI